MARQELKTELTFEDFIKSKASLLEGKFSELDKKYGDEWRPPYRMRAHHRGTETAPELNTLEHLKNCMRLQLEMWSIRISAGLRLPFDTSSVEITNNLQVQASISISRNGNPTFNFSAGLYLALLDAACHSLSSKGFLDIGYTDKEASLSKVENEKEFARFFDYSKKEGPESPWEVFSIIPGDDDALIDVEVVANIALGWILAHEAAHFKRGHLSVLSDHLENQTLDFLEAMDSVGAKISPAEQLAFEIDADDLATELLSTWLEDDPLFFGLGDSKSSDIKWRTRFLGGCLSVAFTVLEAAKVQSGASVSYPSPRTRLILATQRLLDSYFVAILGERQSPFYRSKRIFHAQWVVSGIMADASLCYRETVGKEGTLDLDPIFFDDGATYGAFSGAVIVSSLGLIDLESGEPPFYVDRALDGRLDDPNDRFSLEGMPETVAYTPVQKLKVSITRSLECSIDELKVPWMEAVETIRDIEEFRSHSILKLATQNQPVGIFGEPSFLKKVALRFFNR